MGWFTAKCPVDAETKAWLDQAFDWLVEEFGIDTLRSVEVVLPTEEFFPGDYDGSASSVGRLVDCVCEYMDVDPESIDLQLYENFDEHRIHPLASDGASGIHALGTYHRQPNGKCTISLDITQANNASQMIATIAHELGHVILLGEGRLDEDYRDHEPMTDLVTVFYGLGIFNANASFVFEQWTNSQFQGWRASSAGYLSEEAFGYALALFAYLRTEQKPAWTVFLSTNVKSYFKSSLAYLSKTNDTPLTARISPTEALKS